MTPFNVPEQRADSRAAGLFPLAFVKTTAFTKLKPRVEGPTASSRPHRGKKRRSEGKERVKKSSRKGEEEEEKEEVKDRNTLQDH
ncbi:uncharacterized protein LOC108262770 [Tachysurus ichikawai]